MTTATPMKTFADVKRRIQVGTRLLCVENTYRPVLNGTKRTVVRVQTNAFMWTQDGSTEWSWTRWEGGAKAVTIVDADTFDLKLFDNHHVRIRFVTDGQ